MRSFIEDGGYVASCLFKDGEFVFDITNDLNYARRFAGSKYVKSNPEGIYKKIAQKLKEGNKVMFIGLPCQVAALKNYVKIRISYVLLILFAMVLLHHKFWKDFK